MADGGQETPGPAPRPEGFDLGEQLMQQALRLFWLPGYSGQQMMPMPDGYGGVHHIAVPQFNGPTPLQSVANLFYKSHGEEIIRRVLERTDLTTLVEQIAALVVRELATDNRYDRLTPQAEKLREDVRKRVAEKLSEAAAERHRAQEEAMLAAWHREQARERQEAVAQGDGVERIDGG